MGLFHGGILARTNTRTVTLTPKNGVRNRFHAWVFDPSDPTDWQKLETAAVQTLDLDTVGAGGRHTADALEASKIYLVYEIAQAGLAGAALLAARDDVVPTLPNGYVYCSPPLGWVRLDGSSNVVLFKHSQDGWIEQALDAFVLSSFNATMPTAVNCTDKLPDNQGAGVHLCDRVKLFVTGSGAEGTDGTRQFLWAHDALMEDIFDARGLTTDADDRDADGVIDVSTGFRALATTYYAHFDGAINGNVDVMAWAGRVPGWQ